MTKPLALLLCALVGAGCKDSAKAPAPAPAAEKRAPAAARSGDKIHEGVDEAVRISQDPAEARRAAGVEIVGASGQILSEAEIAAAEARAAADTAAKVAASARERVTRLEQGAAEMTNRINEMIGAIDSAQSEAERTTARAKLAALQKENAQVQAQIEAARAEAAKAERQKGVNVSKECLENPLAKGCL